MLWERAEPWRLSSPACQGGALAGGGGRCPGATARAGRSALRPEASEDPAWIRTENGQESKPRIRRLPVATRRRHVLSQKNCLDGVE